MQNFKETQNAAGSDFDTLKDVMDDAKIQSKLTQDGSTKSDFQDQIISDKKSDEDDFFESSIKSEQEVKKSSSNDEVQGLETQLQVAKELAQICESQQGTKVPFVGVAGAGASGKSFFCQSIKQILLEQYGIEALVVTMDGYHYYRSELDKMENPEYLHARRGAEFTFDADRFVRDIQSAVNNGTATFPGFDHAKKDPEEGKIKFDSSVHKIVLVEGLYVLLNKEPWCQLKHIFDRTYYVDTQHDLIIQRHKTRMTTEMGLTLKEAEKRIFENDMVNAEFISANTVLENHYVLQFGS